MAGFRDLFHNGGNIRDIFSSILDYFGMYMDRLVDASMSEGEKERMTSEYDLKEKFYQAHESMPAKVAEYQDAGLNPMLIAGSGPVAASTAPSASGASAPAMNELFSAILNYKLGQRKLDIEEQLLPYRQGELGTRSGLNIARANEINTLLPERVENLRENTNLLIERAVSEQYNQDLMAAGITQKEAEAALLVRQEAILAIDEKNRQRFLDIDMDLKSAQARMARAAASRDFAEVARIQQETANLQVEHDNLLKEGVGIVLNNGKLAHEFSILGKEDLNTDKRIKQENAQRVVGMVTDSIDSVVGIVSGVSGVASAGAALRTAAASSRRARAYEEDVYHRIQRDNERALRGRK